MRKVSLLRRAAAFGLAVIGVMGIAAAQSNPQFVRLSNTAKAALYMPDQGEPKVGILLMHEDSNFMSHIACTEFSKRGYAVLCVNGRSENNESLDDWIDLPLDAAAGMHYLRDKIKLPKVLIFAHSGGGPLLSFYEAVAENGPAYCQNAGNLAPCGDNLKGLPKADGMIFFDAHPGTGINLLRSLDPSVVSEDRPDSVDPRFDAFNPANGFNPNGESHYSDAFKNAFFKAQADRMNRLIAVAQERQRMMKANKHVYSDDDIFVIPRVRARLMELDLSIDGATVQPRKLIKNDGSIITGVVHSVRVPAPSRAKDNRKFDDGATILTVNSFLAARAVRARDAMADIDYASNNNSTPRHIQNIHVPILMAAAGGHYFMRDNEMMFDLAASPDKDFVVIEGAAHGIVPCTACEKTRGQYSNTVKNTFDYMKQWIDKRF